MGQPIPIIVGVAQVAQRVNDPLVARAPLELMADAIRAAAEDTQATPVLQAIDSIRGVQGMWG